MKVTEMYAAKRALFAALEAQTGTGMPLEGVQVSYSYPGRDLSIACIYGGGIRSTFDEEGGAAEYRVMIPERIVIGTYIRVLRKDAQAADVEASDQDAENIAQTVSDIFDANPKLAGNLTWLGFDSAQSDYAETADGPETIMSLQVTVQAMLT